MSRITAQSYKPPVKVSIPLTSTTVNSTHWLEVDIGVDLTTDDGEIVIESFLGDLDIQLPIIVNKVYHTGVLQAEVNDAYSIRAIIKPGTTDTIQIKSGFQDNNGGSTNLQRIWYKKR